MSGLKVEEIRPEAKLSLLAVSGKKTAEIELKAMNITEEEEMELRSHVSGSFIPLEVVKSRSEDRESVINFQNAKADISLLVIQGADVYRWDDVVVDMLTLSDGKRMHLIRMASDEGKKFNRRRGVRIDIDIRMNVKQNHGTASVIVKDISYCGFKMLEMKKSYIDATKPFILELVDPNTSGDKIIENVISAVVRQKVLDNGDVVSGCRVSRENYGALQKYIAVKQLERMRGRKGNGDLVKNENHENWKESIVVGLNKEMQKNKPE